MRIIVVINIGKREVYSVRRVYYRKSLSSLGRLEKSLLLSWRLKDKKELLVKGEIKEGVLGVGNSMCKDLVVGGSNFFKGFGWGFVE